MTIEAIAQKIEGIENALSQFQQQAKLEIENTGKTSTETKSALEKIGEDQRDIAARLLSIEQKGGMPSGKPENASWGKQFVNSANYQSYVQGNSQRARFEVQNNTITGSDTTVPPDRKTAIVPGPEQVLTLESFLNSIPTSSNAIEFTKEASFTNNAAETAEAAQKPESSLTFSLVSMPVSTVAHWIKISKQLASDAPALAAYINNRMVYGVNRKVETQLATGDGTAPNISGIFDTGNFTPHGYADAALGTVLKKFVLIRKIIADLWTSGYPADAILVNPGDWATMDIERIIAPNLNIPATVDSLGNTRLFGLPVIPAVGVASETFAVGAFRMACTIHNRQGVMVDLSESDADNFTKNLVTVRAERRLALTVEVPAAIRGGDLTPA